VSAAPAFVDTNVLVYAVDPADPRKRELADQLLEKHRGDLVISTQVMIELYAVCASKLGMSAASAGAAVSSMAHLPVVPADRELVLDAVSFAQSNQLSVFDAAIVCAALRAGCETLFTEDLSDAQKFGGLTIVNPFK
jgi:predicted nucleic acid-binding protein